MNPNLVLEFASLFDGRGDAYGVDRGGVVREPVTANVYQDHLIGKEGLGIFPVRDDNSVKFAAVDLDENNPELVSDILRFIPGGAWVEQSRSGNFHLWVFFTEDVEAWVAQAILRDAVNAAGAPRTEVFPKQAELLPGMVGNYINLPYFSTTRPILGHNIHRLPAGIDPMDPMAFVPAAAQHRTDSSWWRQLAIQGGHTAPGERSEDGTPFGERSSLHECATYMLEHKDDNPLESGHRHVVLFNLAKMVANTKGYDEEDTLAIVSGYNDSATSPLDEAALESLVRNAYRGEYTSTGCDDPLMSPYVSPTCPIAHG